MVSASIRKVLIQSDDLRHKPWRGMHNIYVGHCYVVSEAAYHLLGGKKAGWTPYRIKHEGATHWWLKHQSGRILDLTAKQFQTPVPYCQGRGGGFLTKQPSKRALELMRRVTNASK